LLNGISGRRKRKQSVNVIGHEKKNVREPNELLMAEFDSVEQGAGEFGKGELSPASVLAAYCHKIDFFLWIDPKRHTVRQRMTVEKCQLDKDGFAAVSVKPILRQPSPALDASARRRYHEGFVLEGGRWPALDASALRHPYLENTRQSLCFPVHLQSSKPQSGRAANCGRPCGLRVCRWHCTAPLRLSR
jgi:hypothetical protein